MTFKIKILCLSLLTSFSFLAASPTRAAEIAGQVINGTNNNRPVPRVALQLVRPAIDNGATVVLTTTRTDAQGRFHISSPNIKPDDLLTARIDWQGFTYEIPAFDGAGQLKAFGVDAINSRALELTVFDSTTVAPPLTFTVHHVALSVEDHNLKCVERFVIENPASRTYIGAPNNHVTIDVPLPNGAENVALDESIRSARLVKTATGYGVTLPITPQKYDNRNAIIINYTMPWVRGGIDLSRRVVYPTRFFFINREEKDRKLKITAPQLGPDENQKIPINNQEQLRIVNSKGFPNGAPVFKSGDMISMHVTRATNPLVWAFVGFVGALSIVVPLTLLRFRAPGGGRSDTSESEVGYVSSQIGYNSAEPNLERSVIDRHYGAGARAGEGSNSFAEPPALLSLAEPLQECVRQMARLDDEWEAGTITRLAYQEQRVAWRSKALAFASDVVEKQSPTN